jgi:hypothetical protein
MNLFDAPHTSLKPRNAREELLASLLDILWENYRRRMQYVVAYEELLRAHHARFWNDHVAFRCLAAQRPMTGIHGLSRPFEALGYVPAGAYRFPDKKLTSIHYSPPRPDFPKLFISQLHTWELSEESRRIVGKSLASHRADLDDKFLTELSGAERLGRQRRSKLIKRLRSWYEDLPWELPQKKDVTALDKETPFGAWVLVNGYGANHFTASVDSHGVKALDDIEKVQEAMRKAGIPMKQEIEGARGSRLRQTATEAVVVPTRVKEGKKTVEIPWSYAYFEIAQRPPRKNPATGRKERFEGFLGGQATNLFAMTDLRR